MEDKGRLLRLGLIGLAVLVVLIGVWFAYSSRLKKDEDLNEVTEVTIERGEVSMTLTREGTLTVRLPEGVFQQQWDEERVRAFFAKFEATDLSSFEVYGEEVEGYVLTITRGDGSTVTYIIPFFDGGIPLPEIIEELIDILEDVTTVTPTPTPTPTPTAFPTWIVPTQASSPSPTLPPAISTPIPTQTPSGNGSQTQQPFQCEFYDPDQRPDIISETACTPE